MYCIIATAYFQGHDCGHRAGRRRSYDAAYNAGHVDGSNSSYERGNGDGMVDALEMLNALQAGETLPTHSMTLFSRAMAQVSNNKAPGVLQLSLTLNA